VLAFGGYLPRPLRGMQIVDPDDIASARRVVVVGTDADLASVLTRLLRAELLNVEVAYVPRHRTPATRAYRLPSGARAARRARRGTALFDGDVPGVRIEPTAALPGLRARVSGERRWLIGRAAQLGSVGASVIRDGVATPRPVRRSTIYRNTEGWLAVR
jgi:hypothetical protein